MFKLLVAIYVLASGHVAPTAYTTMVYKDTFASLEACQSFVKSDVGAASLSNLQAVAMNALGAAVVLSPKCVASTSAEVPDRPADPK